MKRSFFIALWIVVVLTVVGAGVWYYFDHYRIRTDNTANLGMSSSSEQSSLAEIVLEEKSATLVFAGDAMFDRGVDCRYPDDKILTIFDNLDKDIFVSADFTFLNLEGPIAKSETTKVCGGSLVFNMPPKTIDALKLLGVDSVSLANNHSTNAGNSGFVYTKELLNSNDIVPIGKYSGVDEDSVKKFEINDQKFAIITLDTLAENVSIENQIKTLKAEEYFTFVYPHWGTEYKTVHNSNQAYLAHRWIDQGADLIIGGHPHVTQDVEVYKDHFIAYSLGNFVFDQAFSTETQRGLVLQIVLNDGKASVELKPTKSVLFRPEFLTGDEKAAKQNSFLAPVSDFVKDGIIVL